HVRPIVLARIFGVEVDEVLAPQGVTHPIDALARVDEVDPSADTIPPITGQQETAIARREFDTEPLLDRYHSSLSGWYMAHPARRRLLGVQRRTLIFVGGPQINYAVLTQVAVPLLRCGQRRIHPAGAALISTFHLLSSLADTTPGSVKARSYRKPFGRAGAAAPAWPLDRPCLSATPARLRQQCI